MSLIIKSACSQEQDNVQIGFMNSLDVFSALRVCGLLMGGKYFDHFACFSHRKETILPWVLHCISYSKYCPLMNHDARRCASHELLMPLSLQSVTTQHFLQWDAMGNS